jgi:hypothetical protein
MTACGEFLMAIDTYRTSAPPSSINVAVVWRNIWQLPRLAGAPAFM